MEAANQAGGGGRKTLSVRCLQQFSRRIPIAEDEMERVEGAEGEMMQAGAMRGRITSVVGRVITVKLENGETETFGVSSAMSREIVPGTQVLVRDDEIIDYGPYLGG